MGLSLVSELNGNFSRKSQIFLNTVYFAPLLNGFPLELDISDRSLKKLEWWGYRAEKEVWRYLQPSGYNTQTWRTDRQTDTSQQQRRIASRS